MMPKKKRLSKKEFKKEYTLWIQSAAKDVAFALNQLEPHEMKKIVTRSEQYFREPESVYGTEGLESVRCLVPPDILLLSTDAVVFSQSIFVRMPSVFDYAVALNLRYYLGVRKFTPEEKRKISDDTLNKAIEKSGITHEDNRNC